MQAKIADFGWTKAAKDATTTLAGSRYFVPPEVSSKKGWAPTSDVFSLGLVLWRLCHAESVHKAAEAEFPGQFALTFFPKWTTDRDHRFKLLFDKCMLANPSERPTLNAILSWVSDQVCVHIACYTSSLV